MESFLVFLLFIVVYIACFFALQILLFRSWRFKQLIFTFSAIAFASAAIVWVPFIFLTVDYFPDDSVRNILAFAGAFGSLGFSGTYIILGPISADRSLSAHICIQMKRAGGSLSRREIMLRYPQEVIFEKRFDEYEDVGVMIRNGDKMTLTASGYRVANIFDAFLRILKMKENF